MPSVWMMDGLALIQFDSTTTAIINQTVPGVSPGAGGMALSPDGRQLYLVDPTTSIVQYRDSSTLGLVNSTTLGVASGNRQSYVSVDGTKLYVVDRGSGIIYLLDAFTLATITSTFIGNLPLNVVQTPDGTKLYIPQQGANRVLVLNATTLATITTVAVGSAANWVQITNDGAKVYCVNISGGTVSVIATASNTVTTTIAPPAGVTLAAYMSMSPTSDYLYVWELPRFVIPAPPPSTYLWKIDTATDTIAQTINPSAWVVWVTPSADNKYLWTTQSGYGTGPAAPIFNIPSLSSSSTITTPLVGPGIMVAFSNPRPTPNPPATQKFRPLLFVPRKGMSVWNPTDVDINWNAIERWASAMGFPVIFPFRSQSRMLTANELDANWHRMEIWAASSGVYPPPDNVIAPLLIQRKNSTAPQDLSINFLRIQDWANGQ